MSNKYCNSLTKYSRYKTRIVNIGDIPIGGGNPIRVQSMTTTNTLNISETINQSIRIFDSGSDYVRITAPSIKEAKALKQIKKGLIKKGYKKPLIADIHFTPNAAIEAAEIVEKVRINPGNYADRKKFVSFEYTDEEYKSELDRIYEKFSPLVKVCKNNGTAIRIGTNHGSLSDRIMNRYGDTPLGMVESALEFIRICEDNNFHDIVLSMKSSNPIIMVNAYRLLVNKMIEENMNYPLHLGVTEAGEGSAGRIKSSMGIGALLEDGLGDTVRVSLTEEPEFEIPVAQHLIKRYTSRNKHSHIQDVISNPVNPFKYSKRSTKKILNIGGNNVPRVIIDFHFIKKITPNILTKVGYTYSSTNDKWTIGDLACDYIDIGAREIDFNIAGTLGIIQDYSIWNKKMKLQHYPKLSINEYISAKKLSPLINFLYLSLDDLTDQIIYRIKKDSTVVLILDTLNKHGLAEQRRAFIKIINSKIDVPIIISRCYEGLDLSSFELHSSTDVGGLLVDGFGNGLYLLPDLQISLFDINKISFGILQASRTRITKTEYISCPSCGRTQFDLQETTALVREHTSHLKGLKIAIMGCIVNGPGEMADADYGYVGTGNGLISLYKKHNVLKKNIPMDKSVDELINIIKINGDWVEP